MLFSSLSGMAKNAEGKHKIRGDINVLVLGDPGTASIIIFYFIFYEVVRMSLKFLKVCLF